MKVFLAGATGVLGRRLVFLLRERGHEIVALARTPEKARWLRENGAQPREASLYDTEQLVRAAEGCEVVVHAATAIPQRARTSLRDWAENDRIRRDGTKALADCAARFAARCYVQQSVVWVARPDDGGCFDESSPTNAQPLMQSAIDGEQIALEAGTKHGFCTTILRCGWFYGADASHTRMFAEGIRKRQIPIVGSGDALWACLHLDDAAMAFLTAIEQQLPGTWHVVDDEPVSVGDFLRAFAQQCKAKPPRRIPVWLARFLAGKQAVEFFTRSTLTSNKNFCRDFGWRPLHPSYREGLKQVVDTWNSDSVSQRTSRTTGQLACDGPNPA